MEIYHNRQHSTRKNMAIVIFIANMSASLVEIYSLSIEDIELVTIFLDNPRISFKLFAVKLCTMYKMKKKKTKKNLQNINS